MFVYFKGLMVHSMVVIYTVYTSSDSEMTFECFQDSYSRVLNSGKKKAAEFVTFTFFPLLPAQQAGDNGTKSLLINLGRLSCTNYFM